VGPRECRSGAIDLRENSRRAFRRDKTFAKENQNRREPFEAALSLCRSAGRRYTGGAATSPRPGVELDPGTEFLNVESYLRHRTSRPTIFAAGEPLPRHSDALSRKKRCRAFRRCD